MLYLECLLINVVCPLNKQYLYRLIEEKSNETEGSQLMKSLSTILEASKERNSSSLSGTVTNSTTKKQEISTIDFGINIRLYINLKKMLKVKGLFCES